MPIRRVGESLIVNTTAAGDQNRPSVVTLSDGRLAVTWSSLENGNGDDAVVRLRLFDADGHPLGDDTVVSSGATGFNWDSSATALPDGRLLVTWSGEGEGDDDASCIRARLFDDDGLPLGDHFLVNTTVAGSQVSPSVTVLADGRIVMAWESQEPGDGSDSCIRARMFDAAGDPAGADFIANSTSEGYQGTPVVRALPDGRFVMTWQSHDEKDGSLGCVRGRLFGSDGTPEGDDFIVNSTVDSYQELASIAALDDGRLVAAWTSYDSPGDDYAPCIRARIIDPDGSFAGDDFLVNTTGTGGQQRPSVTALADGRFVVAWDSDELVWPEGGVIQIRARLFDADGSPVGHDFVASRVPGGFQDFHAVSALPDGRFVVTFTAYDDGDGDGTCIRSRIFDPTVFKGTGGRDFWTGGGLDDRIAGRGGDDHLRGRDGDDRIDGDGDDDRIRGGLGTDSLTGGAGADVFIFGSPAAASRGAERDVIEDFVRGGDRIDLAGIDANTGLSGNQAFTFVAAAAFSDTAGELRCKAGILAGDVDGDGVADFQIALAGVDRLGAADILL